jgi:hypothetical protein
MWGMFFNPPVPLVINEKKSYVTGRATSPTSPARYENGGCISPQFSPAHPSVSANIHVACPCTVFPRLI